MQGLVIPETVEDYQADLFERAFPDSTITDNPFYRNLIQWVVDHRTPLLYEQDHPDEYTNLSLNFNWLLLRDYSEKQLGPPETVLSMYTLHEFAHMTHWLPTNLDRVTADEYAEAFARSEYRASNETEILLHYRIPELRDIVLPGITIAFDLLQARGVAQPRMEELANLRPLLVEHRDDDTVFGSEQYEALVRTVFGDHPEAMNVANHLRRFNGNREWARERFAAIRPHFLEREAQKDGIGTDEYEERITTYEPQINQARYEANVIRNVRYGYAMCGLDVPDVYTINHAVMLGKELEGHHAITQSV